MRIDNQISENFMFKMSLLALSLTTISLLISTSCAAQDKPNILWIIGEDMGPQLGCYGTEEIRSPNIDSLADRGMRFTHAFTVTPVCSTSRSSFMTGMYACSINAQNHRSFRKQGDIDQGTNTLPDGVKILPHWLKDNGYFTANVVQLADDPKERFYRGTGKTDWNFQHPGDAFDSKSWDDLQENQPFFAQINFPETHRGGAWDNAHNVIEKPADPTKVSIPPYYPDHPLTRSVFAQYYNAVMSLDKKVGYVLEKLEEGGLADNTIVIFMGDHGRAMVRGKQWPYDSGLRVPLIIAWPEGIAALSGYVGGTVSDRLIESIDVSATILGLAGVSKPKKMQGRVLLGANAEPPRARVFGMRDRGDETVLRIRTVRDRKYRYIRNFMPERPFLQTNRYKEFQYPIIHLMRYLNEKGQLTPVQARLLAPSRPAEELYDLEKDPHETENLIGDAGHTETAARLRSALEEWIIDVNDQGRTLESKEIHDYWERRAVKNYSERLKTRVPQYMERIRELEEEAQ
jgi:arylsulfatase A-like enzyme